MADAFEAFGSDSDDESDNDNDDDSEAIIISQEQEQTASNDENSSVMVRKSVMAASLEAAFYLAKTFLHTNSKISIGKRRIAFVADKNNTQSWSEALRQRGFEIILSQHSVVPAAANKAPDQNDNNNNNNNNTAAAGPLEWYDAVLFVPPFENKSNHNISELVSNFQDTDAYHSLIPGGILLIAACRNNSSSQEDDMPIHNNDPNNNIDITKWRNETIETIFSDNHLQVVSLPKRLCQIQEKSCPWLSSPKKHSIPKELQRVQEATVPISSLEIQEHCLTETTQQRAVEMLQDYGYCILPRLLDPEQALQWGKAILADLHHASSLLLEKEGVDIFHPHSSKNDPQSYRELSMREDLRMDLRDGPELQKIRGCKLLGNKPLILKANETMPSSSSLLDQNGGHREERPNPFFRHDPSILEIVRRTMNPKAKVGDLYKGNFGRYNFGGSGPDGSFQDMRLGWIGGIVSLPGSADQALHADAPHLFETGTLPAHYINAFTPGCSGSADVGCTAFIHGSHRIEFTTQYMGENNDDNKIAAIGNNSHEAVFDYLVRPQLELGDVLLFDCRTLHFGLANTSKDIERPLVYCNMTHAWFHDPKNWVDEKPIFE